MKSIMIITAAWVSVCALAGCSDKKSAPNEKEEKMARAISDARHATQPSNETLDINVHPDFDSISRIVRYADGLAHTIYEKEHGLMADHVKFSVSSVKPNRIWKLASAGSGMEGFNADGAWFGKGVLRERLEYGSDGGRKMVVYEMRQLQSDQGKPPYELKAVRTEYRSDSGLIDRTETVIHGRFDALDASGLMLEKSFEAIKDLPDVEYTDIRHDFDF